MFSRHLPPSIARVFDRDQRLLNLATIYWFTATVIGGVFPLLGASTPWASAHVAIVGGQLTLAVSYAGTAFGRTALARNGFLTLVALTALGVITASHGTQLGIMVTFVMLPGLALFIGGNRTGFVWLLLTLAMVMLFALGDRIVGWQPVARFPMMLAGTVSAATAASWGLQWYNLRVAEEQRNALEQARRLTDAASRAKSAFLAVMSHELRTPLNGILGLTHELLERPHPPEDHEMLETIRRSGDALLALLNDILDLSKVESGQLSLVRAPYAPREVFATVEKLFAPGARERGVTLSVTLDDSLPPWLDGDMQRLRQVLFNLVSNALKFTPRGEVSVHAAWSVGELTVTVRDTGIGMNDEVLSRLFTPFYQGDSSSARRAMGTGLGLAISRELVTRMGGSIAVDSKPGAGSRFTFTIEALEARAPSHPSDAPAREGVLPKRVLLVEDNAVNRRVATLALRKMGVLDVVIAEDGQQALERLDDGPVDLVLMDVQMPVLDGLEATRRIRALPDGRSAVPVVALTAAIFEDEQRAVHEAGMDGLVAKPLRPEALRNAMIAAFEARRPRAARTPAPPPHDA